MKCVIQYLLLLLFVGSLQTSAAQRYLLKVNNNPLNFSLNNYTDSISHLRQINKMQLYYFQKGYWNYQVDSIVWIKDTIILYNKIGNKKKISSYSIADEKGNNMVIPTLQTIGGYHLDTNVLANKMNAILTQMENVGYPFASVRTKVKQIDTSQIEIQFTVDKGMLFTFDTILLNGTAHIKNSFLGAYLGIVRGKNYSEKKVADMNKKLQQLNFITIKQHPQVVYTANGKARPYIILDKKKADKVNGIIGLSPNGNANNKPLFTGEFLLHLNNLFSSGKMLLINWRSFKARSQELKTQFNYPYLFKKPFGIDVGFDFTKFDTLYTTSKYLYGLQYYTSGLNGAQFFYSVSNTNLLQVDTQQIRNTKQFPITNSMNIKQYGVQFLLNTLNYQFNPQRGEVLKLNASAGTKQILRDNRIEAIKFNNAGNIYTLYDSSVLKYTQINISGTIEKFFPIKQKSVIKLGAVAQHLIANKIFYNELFRLGGFNNLKGFNEQSIFATNFNMLEVEYRYLLNENSFLKAFWNGAYYENRSQIGTAYWADKPWGFGVGANLETGAGILSLMYALGTEKGNKFDLRAGKIHFGVSSYF